jgi:hypothetical protein
MGDIDDRMAEYLKASLIELLADPEIRAIVRKILTEAETEKN